MAVPVGVQLNDHTEVRAVSTRFLSSIVIMCVVVFCAGCSPAARSRIGAAAAGAANGASGATYSSKLMLFGGEGHHTYLGCLNCSEYASDSVFNKFGDHGSAYSSASILNHYGDFGSKYSNYGACNPYANDPPVIVDCYTTTLREELPPPDKTQHPLGLGCVRRTRWLPVSARASSSLSQTRLLCRLAQPAGSPRTPAFQRWLLPLVSSGACQLSERVIKLGIVHLVRGLPVTQGGPRVRVPLLPPFFPGHQSFPVGRRLSLRVRIESVMPFNESPETSRLSELLLQQGPRLPGPPPSSWRYKNAPM